MNVDQARLVECNAVVVFRELRFNQVLSELARRLLPEHSSPLITEIPNQLLAVVYPDRSMECQFAGRRVLVSDKRGMGPGEHPFGIVLQNAIEAAAQSSGGRQGIVAYGYNFVLLVREVGASQYISGRFFRDLSGVADAFAGTLTQVGFQVDISVPTTNRLVKLTVRPKSNAPDMIEVSGNYHCEGRSPPTSIEEIEREASTDHRGFLDALRRL